MCVLPLDTPPTKRHIVTKFGSAMEVGTTQMASSNYVKRLVQSGSGKKVRPLGEALGSQIPERSSLQSLLVELSMSHNDLSDLAFIFTVSYTKYVL